MSLIGDTGSGKSTLAAFLLQARRHRIVLRSKPDTVDYGSRRIRRAADLNDSRYEAFELAPTYERQSAEFAAAMEHVWRQGSWCLYVDELFYLTKQLGLGEGVEKLSTQGRSKHITLVTGMQRPVSVTRFAMSQSTHLISFGLEGRDAKTFVEATTPRIRPVVEGLRRHEFVWYFRPDRSYWVGRLQDLGGEV